MSKNQSKFAVYAFIFIIFLLVATIAIIYKVQYENKPGLKDQDGVLNAPYLYSFYVYSNPNIQDRQYYGNSKASITIIAFLDIESEASRYFIKEVFPKIKENYIDTGKVKYYQRNYIILDDIIQKNNNFKYSVALHCISKLEKESYYSIYFNLFSAKIEEIPELLKKYNVPMKEYNDCADEKNVKFDELYEEASEIESLGMVGINQRFYIGIAGRDNTVLDGIPKYTKFEKTIRLYGIQIGT